MTATRPSGLFVADKPVGPSSFAAVARVRKLWGERQVGHGGTLDPMASGVLPILVGEATKLAPYLVGLDKEYVATAELGATSNTYDAEGRVTRVVDEAAVHAIDRDTIAAALARFVGRIAQRPPAYSAIKKDGVRAYQLARQDEAVEIAERTVEIHAITLDAWEAPRARFTVRCGKGTYIRSLAHDLGAALGVGAYLVGLRRTRVGALDERRAQDPFALDAAAPLVPAALAVAHLDAIAVDGEDAARLRQGKQAPLAPHAQAAGAGPLRVLSDGELVAIAEREGERLVLARVFGVSQSAR